ncbi:unnamed protein product [Cylicocyclus nassatus]|uniref:Uncharacterized protein n=1 Tax=Cylicocyclus nassatus TaxID=53992 RepID=A0AA36MBQ1_CYLNA|nr:unnamed protein product [Cylicocyclus nassatus]
MTATTTTTTTAATTTTTTTAATTTTTTTTSAIATFSGISLEGTGTTIANNSTSTETVLSVEITTASTTTLLNTSSSRIASATTFAKFYNDSVFMEVSNASVGKLLLLYFIFYVLFTILMCIAICALRCHYRSKLLDELDNVRQDNEHDRVYYVEAGSGARRVVPPPLSPPLTEQQVYYPLGQMLADEARRAAL